MRLFTRNGEEDNKNTEEVSFKSDSYKSTSYDEPVHSHSESMRLVEEDALLVQIDAFRVKAEKLQTLINDRQNKVLELQGAVKKSEEKNNALKDELRIKQEALENVLEDIKGQLNIFADRLDTSVYNAVNDAKEPVMEKVHSENVRLYRNLYDFMKEEYNDQKLEEIIKKNTKSSGVLMKVALVFSIINTGLLVFMILYSMGIIL